MHQEDGRKDPELQRAIAKAPNLDQAFWMLLIEEQSGSALAPAAATSHGRRDDRFPITTTLLAGPTEQVPEQRVREGRVSALDLTPCGVVSQRLPRARWPGRAGTGCPEESVAAQYRIRQYMHSDATVHAWIWYIGIALNAGTSMPRSATIAATHFGVRPMPLQVSSGFCGLRYFAGRF